MTPRSDVIGLFLRRVAPALAVIGGFLLVSAVLVRTGGPPVAGGYFWDSQRSLSVASMVFGRFLWVFVLEIITVAALFFATSLLFLLLLDRRGARTVEPGINIVLFVLSATPTFIGALFISEYLWWLPDFVLVVLSALIFNLVLASFVRSQRRFLHNELGNDYIAAARLRGGNLFANVVRQHVASTLETIGSMTPLFVASLVVAERVNVYHAGLANFVFNRFSMYLDSPRVNSFGFTYLVWLILISYAVQSLFLAAHAVITRHRSLETRRDRVLPVPLWSTPGSLLSRYRVRRRGSARKTTVRETLEYAALAVIVMLVAVPAVLGLRGGAEDSYLLRLSAVERDLMDLKDSRPDGPYDLAVGEDGTVRIVRSGGASHGAGSDGSSEGNAKSAEGSDAGDSPGGEDSLLGGGLLSEVSPGDDDLPTPSETDGSAGFAGSSGASTGDAGATVNEIRLNGVSSWSPARLFPALEEVPHLRKYLVLGTNSAGESVAGSIIYAIGTYVVPLGAALLSAVGLGMLLAILGGFLLFRNPRWARRIYTAVDTFDTIPKFLLVVLSLLLVGSQGSEQNMLTLIMAVTGFALFPVVYKTVYHQIRRLMEEDFPAAEGILGAGAARILLYHILLRNGFHPLVGSVLEVLGVSVLIESTLGFLDLVRSRYVSLGALVPSNLQTIQNPWEIWAPVIMIDLLIVGALLAHQVMEARELRGRP